MTSTAARRPALASTARAGAAALGRGWRAVTWYVRELMGEGAYPAYVRHHERTHGTDHAPLTEREFWRSRMSEMDADPGARCC